MQRKDLLIFSIVAVVSCARANEIDCASSENPLACRGVNFLSKAINQVITNHDDTLKILPGLEIVQNENLNQISKSNDERSMSEQSNDTVFMRVAKYLQTHDLKVKFSDMVGKTDLQEIVNTVFNNDDPAVVGEWSGLDWINGSLAVKWVQRTPSSRSERRIAFPRIINTARASIFLNFGAAVCVSSELLCVELTSML